MPLLFFLVYGAILQSWTSSILQNLVHISVPKKVQTMGVKALSYRNAVVWQWHQFLGHSIIWALCVVQSTLWSLLSSNIQREWINIFLVIFIAHQATYISGEVFSLEWRKYQNKPTNYTEPYSQTIRHSLHKSMNGYLWMLRDPILFAQKPRNKSWWRDWCLGDNYCELTFRHNRMKRHR